MRSVYTVDNTAVVPLVATVPKTVLAILAPAQFGVDLLGVWVAFDGVTPNAVSAFVELCSLTAASNSTPGTANTSETATILQEGGRAIVTGFTAFGNSTTEPTVLAPFKTMLIPVFSSFYEYSYSEARSPDSPVSQGFALRVTAPATVNVRAGFRFARS